MSQIVVVGIIRVVEAVRTAITCENTANRKRLIEIQMSRADKGNIVRLEKLAKQTIFVLDGSLLSLYDSLFLLNSVADRNVSYIRRSYRETSAR